MDIGESIATAASANRSDPCWFCTEEPRVKTVENLTNESPETNDKDDEDYPPENDVHNDASALGENLGSRPKWIIDRPDNGRKTEIVPGAHHLIPGNASLKKAMKGGLHHFMCKAYGGTSSRYNLESDIGYNVNDAANGVWLPGNYQVRPGNEDYKKKWSVYSEDFKGEYAIRAMRTADAQFHDAHPKYNTNVHKTLEKIKESMIIIPSDGKCPVCKNETHKKMRPPFGLVSRLNFVSQQHRQMLMGLGHKKSRKITMINNGYHTSSSAYRYFGLEKPKK